MYSIMRCRFFLLLSAVVLVALATGARATTGNILHSFDELPNGFQPNGGLVSDSAGNLYGVVYVGGDIGTGGVYRVSPNSHGGWTQTMIYNFGFASAANPAGSLTFDGAGNLYGIGASGYGTIFELTPQTNGQWSEKTIVVFNNKNGSYPVGGLISDSAGNIYGVAQSGGPQGCGIVYRLAPGAKGWTEEVLYSFQCSTGFWDPNGPLVLDGNGNLYGTTVQGGEGYGVVYELIPSSTGWSAQVLYAFSGGSDGNTPKGSVVVDKAGNLFGATVFGGSGTGCYSGPCGVIFELSRGSNGTWTENVIHNFNGPDGASPVGNLAIDADGNLYGSTGSGGSNDLGVAFELTQGAGGWTESVLWKFTGGNDGSGPIYGVILGGLGKVYGVAGSGGGTNGNGAVFELTAGGGGTWTETTLANFADGAGAPDGLTSDGLGNFYGTTNAGGAYGYGAIYEISPEAGGGWTFSIVYNFTTGDDSRQHGYGSLPSQLIFDSAGNLYGETGYGGASGNGMVFELFLSGDGTWTAKDLYDFEGGTDGSSPVGGLTFDTEGNLYGTTELGGSGAGCPHTGCGTVFELLRAEEDWHKTILYNFQGGTTDGSKPVAGVFLAESGKLYGTTLTGGIGSENNNCGAGCGTMFELSPSSGAWSETFVHLFSESHGDGGLPEAGLIMDEAGNLYGTTSTGGSHNFDCGLGCGTVFEFTPVAGGGWTESVIYEFPGPTPGPDGGLIFDSAGNLYGSNAGSVFELTPAARGGWNQTTLYTFPLRDGFPVYAQGNLVFDSEGNLYGTTGAGGFSGSGTVYQITH